MFGLLSKPSSLKMYSSLAVVSVSSFALAEGSADALDPKEWRTFRVSHTEPLTENTSRLRFDFEDAEQKMGLPVASCLLVKAKVNGKSVIRPYTPVSSDSEKGAMELVVKGYPNGQLSKHLVECKVGDEVEMKGPFVKYPIKPNMKKHIGMIAGGSGITPMLQVTKEILRNPEDKTKVTLIFANVSEEDIILRDNIDALKHLYPTEFNIVYTLDKPSETWDGESGFISKEMIQKYMPEPSTDNLIMVCGPPPMMFHISGNKAQDKTQGELSGLLKELDYTSKMVFKF